MASDGFPYPDETQPGNFAYRMSITERTPVQRELTPIDPEELATLRELYSQLQSGASVHRDIRRLIALIDQQAAHIAELEARFTGSDPATPAAG